MESKLRSTEAYFASVTESDIMPGYRYLCADVSDISDPELLFEALKNYVHYLLEEIEMFLNISGRKIDKLTIGKTKAKSKKQHQHNFSGVISAHFTKKGISNRFQRYCKQKGYNFLLGFVIITKDNVPYNATPVLENQQDLTLGLESRLIYYFAYNKCDNRLGNESFYPGKKSKQHAGFAIYIALKTCPWYFQLFNIEQKKRCYYKIKQVKSAETI